MSLYLVWIRLVLLVMVWEFEEWGKVVNWDGFLVVDLSCKGIGVVVGEVGFEIFKFEFILRFVWDGNLEEIVLMLCWKWYLIIVLVIYGDYE